MLTRGLATLDVSVRGLCLGLAGRVRVRVEARVRIRYRIIPSHIIPPLPAPCLPSQTWLSSLKYRQLYTASSMPGLPSVGVIPDPSAAAGPTLRKLYREHEAAHFVQASSGIRVGSRWGQGGIRVGSGWGQGGIRVGSGWGQGGVRVGSGWDQGGIRVGSG